MFAWNYYVGFGWWCYFNMLDVVMPLTPPAVEDMELFFSAVLSFAGNVWAQEPAKSIYRVTVGQIRLNMWSSQPIPFQFIYGYLTGAVCPSIFFSAQSDAFLPLAEMRMLGLQARFTLRRPKFVAHDLAAMVDKSWSCSRLQNQLSQCCQWGMDCCRADFTAYGWSGCSGLKELRGMVECIRCRQCPAGLEGMNFGKLSAPELLFLS